MDIDITLKVAYVVVPILVGLVGVYFRNLEARISKIEEQTQIFVTKAELRQALQDKIEPIREDISEIRDKLDKLYDFLLKQQKS